MRLFKNLLVLAVLLCPIKAENDKKDYRLPKIVKPILYEISITVQEDFPTTKKFTGHVRMKVNILKETSTIVMHSANITYEKTNKFDIKFDEEVDKMILTFENPLKVGVRVLEFKYEGVLHEDMNGFYLSYYEDEKTKEKQWMVTTQFQPTYARRAFPCFDEPEFKAQYQINITRPNVFNSLSNSIMLSTKPASDSSSMDIYKVTPKMSSYLVAFIVSKFKSFVTLNHLNNKKYDVYGTESMLKIASHAYDCGQKFVDRLSKFTGIDYYDSGIPKMHLVAIPDFGAGAMENWGLVTFRETDLLYDEKESPALYKSQVATTVAHELAHMWFGDIVTLEWWSSTWLNEGFAEYFSYYITEQIEETWEVLNRYVIRDMQAIFQTESLSGSYALTSNVTTPEEIADKFNMISYSAGAAIVRMMHFILEDKPFVNAIRDYLQTNKYKNTNPSDLWEAFSKYVDENRLPENTDFGTVMSTWTEQPGFPVVYANLKEKQVVLTQKRLLLNATSSNPDLKWYIPITYATTTASNFSSNTIRWLTPNESLSINPDLKNPSDWVMINLKQYGFYRVWYDDNLRNRLINLLKSDNYVDIHPMNRAQFIDDMFSLAQMKLVKYGSVLDMSLYLAQESDYYPWNSAIRGFRYLILRTGSNKKLIKHILKIMTLLYSTVSFKISPKDSYIDILRSGFVMEFACAMNHPECIGNATALFEEYKKGASINPNVRYSVYCSGIKKSHTNENWKFLWKKYLNATLATEKVVILKSLACTKERNILLEYLQKSITSDSGIRKQDASSVFEWVISSTPTGFDVGYKFFKDNIKEISKYYDGMGALSDLILLIADLITTEEQLNDFEKFLTSHPKELKEAVNQIGNAIEKAKSNLKWPKEEVLNWLDTQYSSSSTIKINTFVVLSSLGLGLVLKYFL